jgi:hypothetical protein
VRKVNQRMEPAEIFHLDQVFDPSSTETTASKKATLNRGVGQPLSTAFAHRSLERLWKVQRPGPETFFSKSGLFKVKPVTFGQLAWSIRLVSLG